MAGFDDINVEKIRELAAIMSSEGLTAIEISGEDGLKLRLDRAPAYVPPTPYLLARDGEGRTAFSETGEYAGADAGDNFDEDEEYVKAQGEVEVDFNSLYEIKSPTVGIFYSAPSPDTDDFVELGSEVNAGDTLCIVEAMKLMNDIVAERGGKIVEICAQNGEIVEFNQTLFKMNVRRDKK